MLTIEQIPETLERPESAPKSSVRQQIVSSAFSRRTFVQAVIASGLAMGLASLDAVAKLTRANAVTTWGDCPNWHPQLSAFWQGEWNRCNPTYGSAAGHVSSSFCAGDGWHKDGWERSTQYNRRPYSCLDRNAWAWRPNGSGEDPPPVRCSDGKFRFAQGSGQYTAWVNSTCKWPI